jgi:putative hemolysin
MRYLVGAAVIVIACSASAAGFAMGNPASQFCVQSGGKSEIRNGPKGQYGVCRLRNGRVVDEWKYFRQNNRRLR